VDFSPKRKSARGDRFETKVMRVPTKRRSVRSRQSNPKNLVIAYFSWFELPEVFESLASQAQQTEKYPLVMCGIPDLLILKLSLEIGEDDNFEVWPLLDFGRQNLKNSVSAPA
jgi:hypothetical protein